MKKKTEPTTKLPRLRRTNSEILKISSVAMRKMRQISEATRLPLDIVYGDALNIGLCGVSELYDTLIQERRKLAEKFERNLEGKDAAETKTELKTALRDDRSGSGAELEWNSEAGGDYVAGSVAALEESVGERSGDVAERSGFSPEDETSLAVGERPAF